MVFCFKCSVLQIRLHNNMVWQLLYIRPATVHINIFTVSPANRELSAEYISHNNLFLLHRGMTGPLCHKSTHSLPLFQG